MKALALATTGVAAVNTYDEVMADPQSAGGMTLSIDHSSSKSQTKSSGASVGVGVTLGSNGVGFVATAGANASRGRSDGKDTVIPP